MPEHAQMLVLPGETCVGPSVQCRLSSESAFLGLKFHFRKSGLYDGSPG